MLKDLDLVILLLILHPLHSSYYLILVSVSGSSSPLIFFACYQVITSLNNCSPLHYFDYFLRLMFFFTQIIYFIIEYYYCGFHLLVLGFICMLHYFIKLVIYLCSIPLFFFLHLLISNC